jgi:hypothetical protein
VDGFSLLQCNTHHETLIDFLLSHEKIFFAILSKGFLLSIKRKVIMKYLLFFFSLLNPRSPLSSIKIYAIFLSKGLKQRNYKFSQVALQEFGMKNEDIVF